MKHFSLVIFFLYLCSGFSIQQTPLLSTFAPMGHYLDCAERCKTCIDENTFNDVHKTYVEKLAVPSRDFKDDDFQAALVKKAAEQKKKLSRTAANRLNGQNEEEKSELSDEEKIDLEVSKSEELLDQEVKVAVEKVSKVEGEQSAEKINDIASRVRARMVEKYRKEAARRLNIDYDSLKSRNELIIKEKKAEEKPLENEMKGKMKSFRKAGAHQQQQQQQKAPEDPDTVYRIYFEICVESGSIFYARAP